MSCYPEMPKIRRQFLEKKDIFSNIPRGSFRLPDADFLRITPCELFRTSPETIKIFNELIKSIKEVHRIAVREMKVEN